MLLQYYLLCLILQKVQTGSGTVFIKTDIILTPSISFIKAHEYNYDNLVSKKVPRVITTKHIVVMFVNLT
jgi:hypothetical protein